MARFPIPASSSIADLPGPVPPHLRAAANSAQVHQWLLANALIRVRWAVAFLCLLLVPLFPSLPVLWVGVLAFMLALGAFLYGTYGLVRGGFVWGRLLRSAQRRPIRAIDDWLLKHHPRARTLAAGQLVVVGVAMTVLAPR